MKIGFNLLLWDVIITDKHNPILEKLKETGYDGVEIFIDQVDNFKYYQNLKSRLDSFGLECTVIIGADEATNPISSDSKIQAAAVDKLQKAIDIANIMGSPVLGGPSHSAYKNFLGGGPTQSNFDNATKVYQEIASYAEKNQVYIALEVLNRFESAFLNTSKQIKKLLDQINHNFIAYHYDTHHSGIEEYSPGEAIKLHGTNNIKHIHISENNRGIPGLGTIQWDENFQAIKDIGYDGWLVIEAFSRNNPDFADYINVWRDYSPAEDIYKMGFDFIKKNIS